MKGLLHRLAARATGTTVPVHSDALLPFAGLGQRLDDATDDIDTQQRAAVDDEPAPLSSAQRTHTGTTESTAREPTQSQSTTTRSQKTQSAPLARANTERNSSIAPAAEAPSVQAAPARLIKDAQIAAPLESGSRTALHAASSHRFATPASPSAAASVIGEPSLLMPPVASSRSVGPDDTAPAALRQLIPPIAPPHATASEEPNEVHIHIGRIEVTAVHEAAAPRRRRESAPAMTLDAYLAKRGHT
jgi:hypothetical protein